ncbi:hypothetical protein SLE2022_076640 [Rubroshorea leprosula]
MLGPLAALQPFISDAFAFHLHFICCSFQPPFINILQLSLLHFAATELCSSPFFICYHFLQPSFFICCHFVQPFIFICCHSVQLSFSFAATFAA